LRIGAISLAAAAAAVAWSAIAAAHGLGMSQLRLRVDGARADGEWDIQLHDARLALGLDPQGTGDPDGQEVRGREAALRAYLTPRLGLSADGVACPVVLESPARWQGGQGEQSLLTFRLSAACAHEPKHLTLRTDLLFDADAAHRAYFSVEDARVVHAGVLRADRRSVTLDIHEFRVLRIVGELAAEGARHIWGGLDHILFLLALLLPAPLLRRDGAWVPRAGLASTARELLKVVTAFTVAHSVTLGLSFAGLVLLPSRLVEVTIALSVFAAAWNNLRPFMPGRAWAMALGFGLVHGLGFAGALRNLSLPPRAHGLALAAFNVGVELGQMAIVVPVLPLLYLGSRRPFYARYVMGAGSLAVAWLAVLWMLERGFDLKLLPRF
jgi:hypothetical protein